MVKNEADLSSNLDNSEWKKKIKQNLKNFHRVSRKKNWGIQSSSTQHHSPSVAVISPSKSPTNSKLKIQFFLKSHIRRADILTITQPNGRPLDFFELF